MRQYFAELPENHDNDGIKWIIRIISLKEKGIIMNWKTLPHSKSLNFLFSLAICIFLILMISDFNPRLSQTFEWSSRVSITQLNSILLLELVYFLREFWSGSKYFIVICVTITCRNRNLYFTYDLHNLYLRSGANKQINLEGTLTSCNGYSVSIMFNWRPRESAVSNISFQGIAIKFGAPILFHF